MNNHTEALAIGLNAEYFIMLIKEKTNDTFGIDSWDEADLYDEGATSFFNSYYQKGEQ